MPANPRVFLDTSALFAGIWSPEGGARLLLKLGESGAIQLVINRQVLLEIENTLRAKAPSHIGALVLLLDRSQIEIAAQDRANSQLPNNGSLTPAMPGCWPLFLRARLITLLRWIASTF